MENNKLTNITKYSFLIPLKFFLRNTFQGLLNLESINLNGNDILFIHEDAFMELRNLKILNIGGNKISKVLIFVEKKILKIIFILFTLYIIF